MSEVGTHELTNARGQTASISHRGSGLYGEPAWGATFRTYLPSADSPSVTTVGAISTAPPTRGDEGILLVDDDEAVRSFTRRVLAAQGYAVFEASSGTEALALAGAYGAEIDLLVTDLVMPGLDGRTLAELLRSSRQDLPVLYVSGFPGNHLDESALAFQGVDFLPKPYSIDAIVRAVRSVLDEMP